MIGLRRSPAVESPTCRVLIHLVLQLFVARWGHIRSTGMVYPTSEGGRMPARQNRQIKAYVMHARTPEALLDYVGYFNWLAGLSGSLTEVQVSQDFVLAVAAVTRTENMIRFRFVSGDPAERPLIFNSSTGQT